MQKKPLGRPTRSDDTRKLLTNLTGTSFSPRELAFARYCVVSSSPTEAARKAGWGAAGAANAANFLMRRKDIRELIRQAEEEHLQQIDLTASKIVNYWHLISHAELPLPDVGCCRYCYGTDHAYQYTLNEYRDALRAHTLLQLKKQQKDRREFDDRGGLGYDSRRPPSPDCPECHGVGINLPLVIDRERLTPAQRMALDEVKVNKDGSVSLRMRDRSRAMENLQRLFDRVPALDPQQNLEAQVNLLLRAALDRGMISLPEPYRDAEAVDTEYADAAAED